MTAPIQQAMLAGSGIAAPLRFTSWWNAFSDGNRTATIAVTTDATISSGPINKLVDGALTASLFWSGGQTLRTIKFDFGVGATVIIDAFGWRQDSGVAHGTWGLHGSNDDSTYTQIGASFALGQSGVVQYMVMRDNSTPYRYYKLIQSAGATSNSPFLIEITFRAASSLATRDPYESGDRTSLITVTTTATPGPGTTVNNLIDGAYSNAAGDSFNFQAAQSTREIKFDLLGVQKVITDFIFLQQASSNHGTWVMEGSNDDSVYTQLGASFTLGSSVPISKYNLSNTTAYRYYKLRQTAGVTTTGSAIYEIEFKI